MSGLDVDLSVLSSIATDLASEGSNLGGLDTAGSTSVDAGPMTSVIASMLAQITDSAGNVADALTGLAELVGQSRQYYQRADADADATMQEIRTVMEQE